MKTSHQGFEINEIYSQDRERARLSVERCTQRDPLFCKKTSCYDFQVISGGIFRWNEDFIGMGWGTI